MSGRSLDGGIDEIPLPSEAEPGRLWLCGKRVVGPDPEAALERVGASIIVCLTERHELEDRYPDYVAWLDAAINPSAEIDRARWYSTPDLSTRPLAEVIVQVDEVVDLLQAGAGVIVHCGAGIGRAGTLATGVLIALGYDVDQALAVVAEHRPLAGPEAGSQSELVVALADSYRPQ